MMFKLAGGFFSREHPDGIIAREVELQNAGRSQVFQVIKPPGALFFIEEIAIPLRVMMIKAVCRGKDGRKPKIWIPNLLLKAFLWREIEAVILAMKRMVVASRKKGPDEKPARLRTVQAFPSQND